MRKKNRSKIFRKKIKFNTWKCHSLHREEVGWNWNRYSYQCPCEPLSTLSRSLASPRPPWWADSWSVLRFSMGNNKAWFDEILLIYFGFWVLDLGLKLEVVLLLVFRVLLLGRWRFLLSLLWYETWDFFKTYMPFLFLQNFSYSVCVTPKKVGQKSFDIHF